MTECKDDRIQKQLEFYFSDANLRRDRFMRQFIESSHDGWVDIALLLTFNKLKTVGGTLTSVAAAALHSPHLECSDDKKRVRRTAPLSALDHADATTQTVYTEGLDPTATIESITEEWSKFGPVVYVSLPRFDVSKEIKGFAFIEYASDAAARRAVEGSASAQGGSATSTSPPQTTSTRSMTKCLPLSRWKELRAAYTTLVKQHEGSRHECVEAANRGLCALVTHLASSSSATAATATALEAAASTAMTPHRAVPSALSTGHGAVTSPTACASETPITTRVKVYGVPAGTTKGGLRDRIAQAAPPPTHVRFRRGNTTAHAEFSTAEDCRQALDAFPRPLPSLDGSHLDAFYLELEDVGDGRAVGGEGGSDAQRGLVDDASSLRAKRGRGWSLDPSGAAASVGATSATPQEDVTESAGSSHRSQRKRARKKDRIHIVFGD
eukprot:m.227542 g.227542  ORF g.227542 m.227542 type:complete len:439 (+) comp36931_c0_seq1:71-1387(+)